MRTTIQFRYGRTRCPLCLINGGSRKQYKDIRLIKEHLFSVHSFNGVYTYVVKQLLNLKGNYYFWVLGKCCCGCGELLTYMKGQMPNHLPPYYKSGHDQRLGRPNKGHFIDGHKSWNKGTKGLTSRNSTSFEKGNVSPKDRGGLYTLPNGQVYEWDGGYQPSGPRKYKARSRRFMEASLGRPLLLTEVVVHLDGNSANDELSNLEVVTRGKNLTRNRDEYLKSKPKIPMTYKPKKAKAKKPRVKKPKKVMTQKPEKIENVPSGTKKLPQRFEPRKTPFCPRCGAFSLPGAPCPIC